MKTINTTLTTLCILLCGCATITGYTTSTRYTTAPQEYGPDIEVTFCPSTCEETLIDFIKETQEKIDCAFFDLNLEGVITALDEKATTSQVRVVIDKDYAHRLERTYLRHDTRSAYMHNKFCVRDDSAIITGSMNPTYNDAYKNSNNLIEVHSSKLAKNYAAEFTELWRGDFGRGSPVPYPKIIYNDLTIKSRFCPEDACKTAILDELSHAQYRIGIMAFSFTDKDSAYAIVEKANKSLEVKGVLERTQNSAYHVMPLFEDLDITWNTGMGKIHHKVFIIDDTVITGSMNPSTLGNTKNDENILIITDKTLADAYWEELLYLKNRDLLMKKPPTP